MGWDSFWRYFKKTWIVEYNPKYWNISLYKDTNDLLRNRTNNPLERYNRTSNDMFPNAHPSMPQFVTTIKGESQRYNEMLKDIEEIRQEPVHHKAVEIPNIPREYYMYAVDDKDKKQDRSR
jgi:hypothetical protein